MSESARHAETGSTAKVMASPVFEKKHQRNGRSAPAHQSANQSSPTAGNQTEILTPPSVSEKKPVTNGNASPVRLPDNSNQTGNKCVESLLKTDDRMRLARERREERERGLAMREQALLEKERRARLQYERTREERWRRLEEQRQKEEQRRAAVEEKRRHQLEEEKERLEALMRKSLERSLQLENRNKRGTYGMTGQSDYTLPHDLIASSPPTNELGNVQHSQMTSVDNLTLHRLCTHTHSSLARCNSDAELCVPCPRHTVPSSPHRSLYCASPSRHRANTVALEMGRANSVPNTPKKKKLHTERRTPAGSPVRRAESPADVIRRAVSPKFSPTHTHSRNQAPVPRRHYTPSPLRPPTILTDDKVSANRQAQEGKGHDPADTKLLTEMKVSVEDVKRSCEAQSPKATDSNTDRSAFTSGKAVARTTHGDEGSHILAEQQRLSHIQKEREEKDRLKAEQQKKNQEDMKEKKRKADEEKELQEKQEVERELIKQQEEQERQQRKKRIEEIMKRTRKRDGELKRDDSQELHSPPSNTHSHTPPVLHNTPASNPPDRRGTAPNVEIGPVTPQRSSPMREEQSTQNSSSEKLQMKSPTSQQVNSQVKSPTSQQENSQMKSPTSQQVKSPTSQQVNSQVKSPTSQQENSQVKSPTSQQVKSPTSQQVKSPTSQQVNSQVKSPTSQQMNSQVKSPTSQQVNSQMKSPTSQQMNSQMKSPTSQQENSQVKSPTSQQVKSPTSQQMNSQVKSPTSQQENSQMKSPTSQQVKSPTSQQVKSPTSQQVKSPTSQQVNSQVKSPTSQQMNSQVKSPTSQQENSQMKSPTSQQVKSPTSQQVKSPTSQQENSQVKSPTSQQENSQVKSPTSQQVKRPTSQQVKSPTSQQVKSPTSQQVNSQMKNPTSQQMNSQVKSPNSQQMNSQMKSPTSQQMNSQVKSPTSQQMNSQVKSPTSQQVDSQVKSPTSQQMNSQVKSLTSYQVNSQMKSEQVNGQASSQVKSTMTPSQVTSKKTSESSFPLSPLPHSQFPPTLSALEYLEKGDRARRESADAVQSMEFSPIPKEELISIPTFSPISEVPKVVNSTRVLEDLLDLTGHVTYPIMQYSTTHGDCNKNVIEPKQTSNTLNMRSRKE
ncbi:ensconsin-like isoform X34 [Tachysurus fulvidraco]|uniref:ensconsin-like isoform X33 n=1 Tax=Tachysurus fulvidraco TaxID=1234273 RepID=UPI001FEE4A60|nr:ensconsin-like isoform X33 [Tachysurus fulvidraco]XP_047665135.1 ensconsin-like isoform X34 [Tachysurus fulvidraco]